MKRSATGTFSSLETRALIVVAILIVILALLRSRGREAEFTDLRATTFFSGKSGLRALYLAAEEVGLPVRRLMRPFTEAVNQTPGDFRALAIVAPDEALTAAEAASLRRWVEDGGRLFYVPRPDGEDKFLGALSVVLQAAKKPAARKFQWSLPRPVELPETPAILPGTGPAGGPSPEAQRLLEGTPERVLGFPSFLDGEEAAVDRSEVLLSDGGSGIAAALLSIGEGRVIVLSHAMGITNGSIAGSGTAPLALRALADLSAGKTMWFDEFHHGFDERGGVVRATWRFLRGDRIGWALNQLALLGVTAVFFAGLRMGRPEAPERQRRRSSLEHVSALAAAYSSARARRRPATLLLEGLRVRLGARSPENLLERLSALAAREPALRESVEELGRALAPDRREAELAGLARAIDRVLAALGEPKSRAE